MQPFWEIKKKKLFLTEFAFSMQFPKNQTPVLWNGAVVDS
jgi:hypothetical protein